MSSQEFCDSWQAWSSLLHWLQYTAVQYYSNIYVNWCFSSQHSLQHTAVTYVYVYSIMYTKGKGLWLMMLCKFRTYDIRWKILLCQYMCRLKVNLCQICLYNYQRMYAKRNFTKAGWYTVLDIWGNFRSIWKYGLIVRKAKYSVVVSWWIF